MNNYSSATGFSTLIANLTPPVFTMSSGVTMRPSVITSSPRNESSNESWNLTSFSDYYDNESSFDINSLFVALTANLGFESVNYSDSVNGSVNGSLGNGTTCATDCVEEPPARQYWALILVLVPVLTLFGNVLVILAVHRERALQTVTNYFIVSLALADLLVAVVVMPFAVYVLVNGGWWGLPDVVCDFYIAMDVTCSTSSIFNLVAISIDRYIAVTQPIKYAKHKNNRRVWLTIALVWAISAAIGSPIVLGLNNTPDRRPDQCLFYDSDFIIYSSLSSFYIPCIIMVFLYYSIFKALRTRARKARAARRPHPADIKPGSVIENVAQTRRLAETALGSEGGGGGGGAGDGGGGGGAGSDVGGDAEPTPPDDERPTNTGSGSQDDDDDLLDKEVATPASDECHVIPNARSADFVLASVGSGAAPATQGTGTMLSAGGAAVEANGNNDSGYAASQLEETVLANPCSSPGSPSPLRRRPGPASSPAAVSVPASGAVPGTQTDVGKERKNGAAPTPSPRTPASARLSTQSTTEEAVGTAPGGGSAPGSSAAKKERKGTTSRFTIYKVNKASRKKREKSSAKKERKATKTLAIVLGVFLVCWVPFFTCNILDAVCTKLSLDCSPGVTAFILTTWLGYMNSFVNPVIYTIYNPEFRKAFKKLMALGT